QYTYIYTDLPSTVEEDELRHSKFPKLSQNYPNPFNPNTIIKYNIPTVERDLSRLQGSELKSALQNVTLKIYDILGREVATLVNEQQKPGYYEVTWNAYNQTSGVYFYKMKAGNFIETKKMILIR
ncbi:MAG: T9SS type A sorting domain-containing protein, partial [Bacteroidota bacterium]